ncbi:MAG: PstS family phosphate ABC transporter substrate-binding protein [Betaproteobacteria bacterium]
MKAALFLMAALGGAASAVELKIGGSGAPTLALKALADEFHKRHPDVRPVLNSTLGTRGGIRAVTEGALDIGVASRELTAEEAARGVRQLEFARTPFVFATALKNKTTRITLKEVVDIYEGRRQTWGDGTPLRLVLRPEGDSDTMVLRSFSEELRRASIFAAKRPGMAVAITDVDGAESLEKIPGAFGTTTLSQILVEKRAIRALVLDGVEPTVKNTAAGRYPLHKRFYLVLREPPGPGAREFVEFVHSAAAQALLSQTGHWMHAPEKQQPHGRVPGS